MKIFSAILLIAILIFLLAIIAKREGKISKLEIELDITKEERDVWKKAYANSEKIRSLENLDNRKENK